MKASDFMIVGQAVGRARNEMPFDSRAGDRLALFLGLSDCDELSEECVLVNLLAYWPGVAGSKSPEFPADEARRVADALKAERPVVLLCGRSVAGACGVDCEFFEPVPWRGGMAVVIPHPSGISHWWNDSGNKSKAKQFFDRILKAQAVFDSCPKFSTNKTAGVMHAKKVSYARLAEGTGYHHSTVARWLRGETVPDANALFSICWFLAIDPTEISE